MAAMLEFEIVQIRIQKHIRVPESISMDMSMAGWKLQMEHVTDHRPVKLLQVRLAIETIVNTGYKASSNKKDYTNVIQLISKLSNNCRVV